MNRMAAVKAASAVFGAALIVAFGAATASAEETHGQDDVDLIVDVSAPTGPGMLALTVAQDSTTLVESGSDALTRQFLGTLPTVTVTDTRASSEIGDQAAWYVLGTVTDFTSTTGDVIPAADLGWTPTMVGYEGDGQVFPGEPVDGSHDGGPGIADQELLFTTLDSQATAPEGRWSASADLVLRTDAWAAPASYTATLTLSLFE